MQVILGYVLIILGVFLVILPVLGKIGILKKFQMLKSKAAGPWDVLLVLAKKTPWPAIIGIVLIFLGLELIGTIDIL